MKSVRLVAEPPAAAPRIFRLVADSPFVDETRLQDWNIQESGVTGVATVDGDGERLRTELGDEAEVERVDATRLAPGRWVFLFRIETGAIALLRRVLAALTRPGAVVETPVVYRNGRVHVRLVGADDALQAVVAGLPDPIDVDVRAVEPYRPEREDPASTLSERQRAAVRAALDLGYYERPRAATHADVAERLDCAPSTASEHLQRAEAKLVRAASQAWRRNA